MTKEVLKKKAELDIIKQAINEQREMNKMGETEEKRNGCFGEKDSEKCRILRQRMENNSGKRVLVYLTLCYTLGIYFSVTYFSIIPENFYRFLIASALLLFIIAGIGVLLYIMGRKGMGVMLVGVYVLAGILGMFRVYTFDVLQHSSLQDVVDNGRELCGTVLEEPTLSSTEKTLAISLGELESGGKKIHGKIIIYCRNTEHKPARRTRIQIQGNLEMVTANGEPVYEGYRKYLLSEGIKARGFCEDFIEIEEHYYPRSFYGMLRHLAEVTREKIQSAAEEGIQDEENRGLLLGVLIGEKKGMSEEQYADIRDAGFSHVVAVSGMHLSYLVFFLSALFAFDPTNGRKIVKILLLPFLLWFVLVADGTPSVCRAAIMSGLVSLGYLKNRSCDTMTSIFLAGLILLVYNPYLLYSMSFTLSFGSTIGLVVFSRKFEKLLPISGNRWYHMLGKKVWGLTAMTLSAILGIGYLGALYFQSVQFGGLLGNIFVMPLIIYIFVGGFAQTILYCLFPWLGIQMGRFLLEPILGVLNWNFGWLSDLHLQIPTVSFGEIGAVCYLLLCILLYYLLSIQWKRNQKKAKEAKYV